MERTQAEQLAGVLNECGVLVDAQVNGTQHRFKLRIEELSPASVIFRENKEHIEDTEYTLIPVSAAESIHGIGKRLFNPAGSFWEETRECVLGACDFVSTEFGRFVALSALPKLRDLAERLTREMQRKADEIVRPDYEAHYRGAFCRALRFFSVGMADFRRDIRVMEGDLHLFWEQVEQIYSDLEEIEEQLSTRTYTRRLRLGDLERPDLRTALKLRAIPRSYDEFRAGLGISILYRGFHPLSFKGWTWRKEFESMTDFESARRIVFGQGIFPIRVFGVINGHSNTSSLTERRWWASGGFSARSVSRTVGYPGNREGAALQKARRATQ